MCYKNESVVKYFYNNGILLAEYGDRSIRFMYGGLSSPIGFIYGGDTYYYIQNAAGDITEICNQNFQTVVKHTYDSWGKLLSIKSADGVDVTNNTSGIGYPISLQLFLYLFQNPKAYSGLPTRNCASAFLLFPFFNICNHLWQKNEKVFDIIKSLKEMQR